MDIGTGLSILGVCAVVVAGVLRMPVKRGQGDGAVQKGVCDERHLALNARLLAMEVTLKEIMADVRTLLARHWEPDDTRRDG